MSLSMYQASVPVLVQFLSGLSNVLEHGKTHALAKKIDPAVLLATRLFPDMFPLGRQVRAVTDHALVAGRLAGVELPKFSDADGTFDELHDRIAKTVDFLKGLTPAQIDGSEDKEITIPMGSGTRTFKGQALLLGFALPNFYFHTTTAYAILRHCGVEIGKRDFMGMPRPT